MHADSFLAQLNPQQREAVLQTEGPVLIIAGAGSGKTRTITYRIAYLLRYLGVPPTAIFAATFTNKAADEMKERVARLIGSGAASPLYLSTFHSLCARLLRRECHKLGFTNRFSICDETDQRAILRDVVRRLDLPADELDLGSVQDYISKAKSHFRILSSGRAIFLFDPRRHDDHGVTGQLQPLLKGEGCLVV